MNERTSNLYNIQHTSVCKAGVHSNDSTNTKDSNYDQFSFFSSMKFCEAKHKYFFFRKKNYIWIRNNFEMMSPTRGFIIPVKWLLAIIKRCISNHQKWRFYELNRSKTKVKDNKYKLISQSRWNKNSNKNNNSIKMCAVTVSCFTWMKREI